MTAGNRERVLRGILEGAKEAEDGGRKVGGKSRRERKRYKIGMGWRRGRRKKTRTKTSNMRTTRRREGRNKTKK